MTTLQFVASWVLFFIAGILILGPDIKDAGSVAKDGVLMVVVSFLTSVLLVGLSLLGSA